jgi:hypothetical protein
MVPEKSLGFFGCQGVKPWGFKGCARIIQNCCKSTPRANPANETACQSAKAEGGVYAEATTNLPSLQIWQTCPLKRPSAARRIPQSCRLCQLSPRRPGCTRMIQPQTHCFGCCLATVSPFPRGACTGPQRACVTKPGIFSRAISGRGRKTSVSRETGKRTIPS